MIVSTHSFYLFYILLGWEVSYIKPSASKHVIVKMLHNVFLLQARVHNNIVMHVICSRFLLQTPVLWNLLSVIITA